MNTLNRDERINCLNDELESAMLEKERLQIIIEELKEELTKIEG